MTPLDDSLRSALRRAAADAPDASHVDAASVTRRASEVRRRRTSYAVGSSMVAIAAIALGVTQIPGTDGGDKTSIAAGASPSAGSSLSPRPQPTASPSSPASTSTPQPTPTVGFGSSVRSWSLRGDESYWTRDRVKATQAYLTYRQSTGDTMTGNPTQVDFKALYSDQIATGSGDVIVMIVAETGRADRVATVVLQGGLTSVVGDQPVTEHTVMVDALIPSDPANIVIALGPQGSGTQFIYSVDNDSKYVQTADGVAQFGRGLESKGGERDYVTLRKVTSQQAAGSVYTPTLDGNELASREPGAFTPDVSQPGRLSSPLAAAQFALAAWLAHDAKLLETYSDTAGRADLAKHEPSEIGADINGGCQQLTSMSESCNVASSTDSHKGLTFTMSGTPSLGFQLDQVGSWIA